MIKFFREIRQKLLTENKFSKYLFYAIGEIILVMVGILLALQVNNWNEEKKLLNLERNYLIGILDDLKTDTTSINQAVIPNFMNTHRVNHRYLDSLDKNNLLSNENLVSKVKPPSILSNSGISFHPTVGTYNAIISAGNIGLIQDKELSNAIQKLYEIWYKRNNEYGYRRDVLMDDIKLKYTINFKYDTKMEQVQNKQLLADLYLMYNRKGEYVGILRSIESEIQTIIQKIENQVLQD